MYCFTTMLDGTHPMNREDSSSRWPKTKKNTCIILLTFPPRKTSAPGFLAACAARLADLRSWSIIAFLGSA